MYRAGDLTEDDTSGDTYGREILDDNGDVICYVIESNCKSRDYKPSPSTEALLSHLNRGA